MKKIAEKDDIWSSEKKTNGKEKEENQTQKENVLSDRQTPPHTQNCEDRSRILVSELAIG